MGSHTTYTHRQRTEEGEQGGWDWGGGGANNRTEQYKQNTPAEHAKRRRRCLIGGSPPCFLPKHPSVSSFSHLPPSHPSSTNTQHEELSLLYCPYEPLPRPFRRPPPHRSGQAILPKGQAYGATGCQSWPRYQAHGPPDQLRHHHNQRGRSLPRAPDGPGVCRCLHFPQAAWGRQPAGGGGPGADLVRRHPCPEEEADLPGESEGLGLCPGDWDSDGGSLAPGGRLWEQHHGRGKKRVERGMEGARERQCP